MASFPSVLSDTLQSITITKIHELEKQKEAYNAEKDRILATADDHPEEVSKRVHHLLDGIQKLPGTHEQRTTNELHNIRRWLHQSACDQSLPEVRLLAFEKQLRSYLQQRSFKFDLAQLYSKLLTEWVKSPSSADIPIEESEGSGSDESFEILQDTQKARLEQLRYKFARVVFESVHTDEVAIDNYLRQLFHGDHGEEALTSLRKYISSNGKRMLENQDLFQDKDLKASIKTLLRNDLLNDEKKATLNDFLKDDAVLSEIKDVLNMRFRDIKTWEWNAGEGGIPVLPRQSLNGKWRVMMDEDVLQAILTHCIGASWGQAIKHALTETRFSRKLWKNFTRLPETEVMKREYYLSNSPYRYRGETNVAEHRQEVYDENFFLPANLFEQAGGYDEDSDHDPTDPPVTTFKDIKQLLLRTVATEVIIRRAIDGEVAVVQSDFQWFATSLPHSTIFAVMRFVGFQEEWITFFKKFLEPPLNLLDGSEVRTRKRGLPMAHVVEKALGELVLVFMDLAVAQTGALMYRFHDDLWLAGKPEQCAEAWKTMTEFAEVMGLEFNKNKTGSVYLTNGKKQRDAEVLKTLPDGPVNFDLLTLDPASGSWIINQKLVDQHTAQLEKQLDGSKSVLQWIKTWNSCIGRFFSYTFGEPANCFGIKHLDRTLHVHKGLQKTLFNSDETGQTVTAHIKHLLHTNFGVDDIPDSFLYLPESLGGLGLKNPFIPLLLLRTFVCQDPSAEMVKYGKEERSNYEASKKAFESTSEKQKRQKYKEVFLTDEDPDKEPLISWQQAQTFMSYEDFTKYREYTSTALYRKYKYFLEQPKKDPVIRSDRLASGLKALSYMPEGLDLKNLDPEVLWTVQFFEDELFERFGGLEVVDKGLLPMGVLKALRGRKVTWQMVL